jgi:hypothetical protein
MNASRRKVLQIAGIRRRQLLEACAHLLEAKKKITAAAKRASSGGSLIPIGGLTDDLNALMGELLRIASEKKRA